MTKNSMLFLFGSCAYPTIEMLWRGRTHASMALAGGVCMVALNFLCCERLQKQPLPVRCAAGAVIITGVELVFGLTVNRLLRLGVWDYSSVPLNFMGQVCLPFSAVWFVLSIPAFAACRCCTRLATHLTAPENERFTDS